jgi:hypothetical protein
MPIMNTINEGERVFCKHGSIDKNLGARRFEEVS